MKSLSMIASFCLVYATSSFSSIQTHFIDCNIVQHCFKMTYFSKSHIAVNLLSLVSFLVTRFSEKVLTSSTNISTNCVILDYDICLEQPYSIVSCPLLVFISFPTVIIFFLPFFIRHPVLLLPLLVFIAAVHSPTTPTLPPTIHNPTPQIFLSIRKEPYPTEPPAIIMYQP